MPLPAKILAQGVVDMVRISDGADERHRFRHDGVRTAPESTVGGPLAIVRTGDSITLDVPARRLTLNVDDAEIDRRRPTGGCPQLWPNVAGTASTSITSRRPIPAAISTSSSAPAARPSCARATTTAHSPAPSHDSARTVAPPAGCLRACERIGRRGPCPVDQRIVDVPQQRTLAAGEVTGTSTSATRTFEFLTPPAITASDISRATWPARPRGRWAGALAATAGP